MEELELDKLVRLLKYKYWEYETHSYIIQEQIKPIDIHVKEILFKINETNILLKSLGLKHTFYLEIDYPKYEEPKDSDHLNIKEAIGILEELDPKTEVPAWGDPHSYRGHYIHLGVTNNEEKVTAKELIHFFEDCIGSCFGGWKGGEFYMHEKSLVFSADEGCSGVKMTKELLLGQ